MSASPAAHNQNLARIFDRIADALELKGESGFRVLAYRKAARVLADLTEDVAELSARGELERVPGIGSGIAGKVGEYLSTGRMRKLDEATAGLPPGLFGLLDIPGVGPKTVRLMHSRLGVEDLDDLRRVVADGSLARLPGMGAKKAENITRGIAATEAAHERMLLDEALALASAAVAYLGALPETVQAAFAGSLRRGKETVGDIDVLAATEAPPRVIDHFLHHPAVREVRAAGPTKASARFETPTGLRQVDIRVVKPAEFGAALQYFTGSKDHNVALRALAQEQGLKLSEYGLFRGLRRRAGRTEAEVYAAVGLPLIPPELREDRGEIAAAQAGTLPELVRLEDVRADLHLHTTASDGAATLAEMVAACRRRGYGYVAVTEHSASAGYAGGLKADALLRFCDRIDRLNAKLRGFRVLKSAEVDIRPDGRLDYPDKVLERLDLVVASIHQAFSHQATERICAAIAHPLVHLIAHPSGRLIGKRPGYDVDLEKVIAGAARHGKMLEINAYPGRLDLSDVWARKAKQAGVLLAVNTDAHAVPDLDWMRYGVITARRAWLEKRDMVNCLPLARFRRLLQGIRAGLLNQEHHRQRRAPEHDVRQPGRERRTDHM